MGIIKMNHATGDRKTGAVHSYIGFHINGKEIFYHSICVATVGNMVIMYCPNVAIEFYFSSAKKLNEIF